jgi:hypothetical protein
MYRLKSGVEPHRLKAASAVALLCVCLVTVGGCSTMFDKEYYVEKEYKESFIEELPDSDIQEVRNYSGMRDALENIIYAYKAEGIIRTRDYFGEVEDDIAKAINAAVRDVPLGVYAVDYIRSDTRSYLTYYEIELRVYYKRTKRDVEAIKKVRSIAEFYYSLANTIDAGGEHMICEIASSGVNEENIRRYVDNQIRGRLTDVEPIITLVAYPGFDEARKIVDVRISYIEKITELPAVEIPVIKIE